MTDPTHDETETETEDPTEEELRDQLAGRDWIYSEDRVAHVDLEFSDDPRPVARVSFDECMTDRQLTLFHDDQAWSMDSIYTCDGGVDIHLRYDGD